MHKTIQRQRTQGVMWVFVVYYMYQLWVGMKWAGNILIIVLKSSNVTFHRQPNPRKISQKSGDKHVFLHCFLFPNLVFLWIGWPWVLTFVSCNITITCYPNPHMIWKSQTPYWSLATRLKGVDGNQDLENGNRRSIIPRARPPDLDPNFPNTCTCLSGAYGKVVGHSTRRYKKGTTSLKIEASRNSSTPSTAATKRVLPSSLATSAICAEPPSFKTLHAPNRNIPAGAVTSGMRLARSFFRP